MIFLLAATDGLAHAYLKFILVYFIIFKKLNFVNYYTLIIFLKYYFIIIKIILIKIIIDLKYINK